MCRRAIERELRRGEQAVADDELVRRTGPRGGGGPVGVEAGAAGRDQHDVGLAGRDHLRGLEHDGDTEAVRHAGARTEPQRQGELLGDAHR